MRKQVYETDKLGFIVEIHIADFDGKGNPIKELSDSIVQIDPPNGLYRARWMSNSWIEDMTQEEIDSLNNQPRERTDIEILQEENKILIAKVQANAELSDFHEELIVELAMMLY